MSSKRFAPRCAQIMPASAVRAKNMFPWFETPKKNAIAHAVTDMGSEYARVHSIKNANLFILLKIPQKSSLIFVYI